MSEASASRVPLGATLELRQKLVVMYALMLCMFLTALDQSIVSTAIPHILADLGGFDVFAWIITLYLLTSTITIAVAGKLSDMFGRKYFLIGGVALFIASSAACGAAPTMSFLIAARGVQGVGGGLIIACVFGTLGDLFTPLERAKYFALFTGVFTFASLAGPTAGGFFADGPGWRWSFYINLPIGLAAASFIGIRLPAGGGAGGRVSQVDFPGALLLGGATISLLMAVAWASTAFGWLSGPTVGLIVLAAVMTGAFLLQEQRHPHAIIPLDLFKNTAFTQAILISIVQSGGVFAATQFLPTFVQTSLGGSATASGIVITPQALGILGSSALTGYLVSRTGRFKRQTSAGAVAMAIGAFMIMRLHAGSSEWHLAAYMVLLGIGGGLIFPVTQVVVQSVVSQDRQGVAASTRQFFVQIAQTVGVAIFGLVLTTTYATSFARSSRADAAALPPATYAELQDPTVALDPTKFGQISAEVLQLPDGQALLDRATRAQRDSVATATDRIYAGVLASALVVLALTLLLREIPLRSTFEVSAAEP